MTTTWDVWLSAGTGPVEARAFVARLTRRLVCACEDAGLELVDGVDETGEAPRSLRVRVRGDARTALREWLGTHALVHDSRRDRSGRRRGHRKRWFVSVSLSPVLDLQTHFDVGEVELRFDRSGGPGGQHVNTSATAVRAVHRSSGVAVRASDSRSQAHNRELALARLADKLHERERVAEREANQEHRARRRDVVRGQAIAVWQLDANDALVRCSGQVPRLGDDVTRSGSQLAAPTRATKTSSN